MTSIEPFIRNLYGVSINTTSMSSNPTNILPFLNGDTRVVIDSIEVGVVSTSPSQIQNFSMKLYRGSTTPVSTSSVVTPVPMGGWSGHAMPDCTIGTPTTNVPSTASASLVAAKVSDVYGVNWSSSGLLCIEKNQRFDVVFTGIGAANVYGTIFFYTKGSVR